MSTELIYSNDKFACPHCGVLAKQEWYGGANLKQKMISLYESIYLNKRAELQAYQQEAIASFLKLATKNIADYQSFFLPKNLTISICHSCEDFCLWVDREIVYPKNIPVDAPNYDMNQDIQDLYNEAATILIDSPKGAAALLRLALQKLLWQLGETDRNIDKNIKNLVSKGLNPKIQKALDFVRVVGNEAVHPGEINLNDNREIALKLFKILNLIANDMITVPKEMDELYDEIIPDDKKEQIKTRDGNQ